MPTYEDFVQSETKKITPKRRRVWNTDSQAVEKTIKEAKPSTPPRQEKSLPKEDAFTIEAKIRAQLEEEYSKKLALQKTKLTSNIRPDLKDPNIPTLAQEKSANTEITIEKTNINYRVLYKIAAFFANLEEPSLNLFLYLLRKTEFGTISHVQIGRKELEQNAIHGRYFKESRQHLTSLGLITFETGYIGNSLKKGTFYSIAMKDIP